MNCPAAFCSDRRAAPGCHPELGRGAVPAPVEIMPGLLQRSGQRLPGWRKGRAAAGCGPLDSWSSATAVQGTPASKPRSRTASALSGQALDSSASLMAKWPYISSIQSVKVGSAMAGPGDARQAVNVHLGDHLVDQPAPPKRTWRLG